MKTNVEPIGYKSAVIKRSVVIAGHKTSVSLEDQFWQVLKRIANDQESTLGELVTYVDHMRVNNNQSNLSSALRLFVLDHVQAMGSFR